jgi:hypothetical protein
VAFAVLAQRFAQRRDVDVEVPLFDDATGERSVSPFLSEFRLGARIIGC